MSRTSPGREAVSAKEGRDQVAAVGRALVEGKPTPEPDSPQASALPFSAARRRRRQAGPPEQHGEPVSGSFNPPPNWPTPPPGWVPAPGWTPDPSWGPPPEGWQLWLVDNTDAGRKAALAGTSVAALWVAALLATGDLSLDDLPRLLLFSGLPAAAAFVLGRRARTRWSLWPYFWLTFAFSLSLFVLTPVVEVALRR